MREAAEIAGWPAVFARIAPRVGVPVRFTFAEHEKWWCHDEAALASLLGKLTGSPRLVADRQPNVGHNISLGWAAGCYQLRALSFAEDCVLASELAPFAASIV